MSGEEWGIDFTDKYVTQNNTKRSPFADGSG